MPTWDEAKRRRNLREHGLDFAGCEVLFDGVVSIGEDVREAYGERRMDAIGWLHGALVILIYTERGDDIHVISLRKATKHEARKFFQDTAHQRR